jgi:hypothetical protein
VRRSRAASWIGRAAALSSRSLGVVRETSPARPFHKPGAGCTACSRCWRSRRTAISSSYPIEQTRTSDAYAARRRRRTRARSRPLSLRLRERLCLPARTPRCRSSSISSASLSAARAPTRSGAQKSSSSTTSANCATGLPSEASLSPAVSGLPMLSASSIELHGPKCRGRRHEAVSELRSRRPTSRRRSEVGVRLHRALV